MPKLQGREEGERDQSELKQAFCTCFLGEAGRIVQTRLAELCCANDPTFDPDPRIHALKEGRREVWLVIQNYLNLTPEELFALKARPILREQPTNA